MLKKTRWLLLPLLALAPLSSVQASGLREGADQGHDVTITPYAPGISRTASGAMGTARLSPIAASGPDVAEDKAIGCSVDVTPLSVLVRCTASNASENLYCTSIDKNIASAVSAMSSDAKITFTATADHVCVRLLVETDSRYQQKVN